LPNVAILLRLKGLSRDLARACLVAVGLGLNLPMVGESAITNSFPVKIQVDAAQSKGSLPPVWRFFGADEPNYAAMKDGRKLLGQLGALKPRQVYFRTHNLLNSGDGTPALKWGSTGAYFEAADGKPSFQWNILDGIFDAYLTNGVRPYVQIGFMPRELSTHPEPYQHQWKPGVKYGEIFTGWAYPPKDYAKWGDLVFAWARHCLERYGPEEVAGWYWEVWNEPNIGYWQGTPEEFFKLHDYAIAGVRRALPYARVGGPDAAGGVGRFGRQFIDHCLRGTNYATGKIGTPLDFISFHAKGSPSFVAGHVRMGIANQLRAIDDGFATINSFPELRQRPVVIGESDPDGCAACQGNQLSYRNGSVYASYTAASFAREFELADRRQVRLEGVLTWAFEFENQPYFAGFRVLASNGLTLPVFNVFRMFSKLSGQRVLVQSSGATPLDSILKNGVRSEPDVSGMAVRDTNHLALLVWHYHDDEIPGPNAAIELKVQGLPGTLQNASLIRYEIDDDHSNAFTAWQRMGSPAEPNAEQYSELEKAADLGTLGPARKIAVADGVAQLSLSLPRQGVTLLVIDWKQ
jgi:xylan 1,4-beta-xylosidase